MNYVVSCLIQSHAVIFAENFILGIESLVLPHFICTFVYMYALRYAEYAGEVMIYSVQRGINPHIKKSTPTYDCNPHIKIY